MPGMGEYGMDEITFGGFILKPLNDLEKFPSIFYDDSFFPKIISGISITSSSSVFHCNPSGRRQISGSQIHELKMIKHLELSSGIVSSIHGAGISSRQKVIEQSRIMASGRDDESNSSGTALINSNFSGNVLADHLTVADATVDDISGYRSVLLENSNVGDCQLSRITSSRLDRSETRANGAEISIDERFVESTFTDNIGDAVVSGGTVSGTLAGRNVKIYDATVKIVSGGYSKLVTSGQVHSDTDGATGSAGSRSRVTSNFEMHTAGTLIVSGASAQVESAGGFSQVRIVGGAHVTTLDGYRSKIISVSSSCCASVSSSFTDGYVENIHPFIATATCTNKKDTAYGTLLVSSAGVGAVSGFSNVFLRDASADYIRGGNMVTSTTTAALQHRIDEWTVSQTLKACGSIEVANSVVTGEISGFLNVVAKNSVIATISGGDSSSYRRNFNFGYYNTTPKGRVTIQNSTVERLYGFLNVTVTNSDVGDISCGSGGMTGCIPISNPTSSTVNFVGDKNSGGNHLGGVTGALTVSIRNARISGDLHCNSIGFNEFRPGYGSLKLQNVDYVGGRIDGFQKISIADTTFINGLFCTDKNDVVTISGGSISIVSADFGDGYDVLSLGKDVNLLLGDVANLERISGNQTNTIFCFDDTLLDMADSKINIVKIDMNHPDLVAFENWQNDGLVFSDGMRNFSNFNRICDTDMDLRIFSLGSQNYLVGGIDGKLTIIGMEIK